MALGSSWVRRIQFRLNPVKNGLLGARLGEKIAFGDNNAALGGLLEAAGDALNMLRDTSFRIYS